MRRCGRSRRRDPLLTGGQRRKPPQRVEGKWRRRRGASPSCDEGRRSPVGANPAGPWEEKKKGGEMPPPFFPIGFDLQVPSVVAVIFHPGFIEDRRRQRSGFYRPLQDKPYRERILRSPEFVCDSSAGRRRQYRTGFHGIKILPSRCPVRDRRGFGFQRLRHRSLVPARLMHPSPGLGDSREYDEESTQYHDPHKGLSFHLYSLPAHIGRLMTTPPVPS